METPRHLVCGYLFGNKVKIIIYQFPLVYSRITLNFLQMVPLCPQVINTYNHFFDLLFVFVFPFFKLFFFFRVISIFPNTKTNKQKMSKAVY